MKFLTILILAVFFGCTTDLKENNMDDINQKTSDVMKSKEGLQLIHHNFAAHCFNKTWEYIEKETLSEEDKEDMITASYASLWHWKKRTDCTDQNLSIAYWQLGRVHCLAGKLQTAEEFGQKCLKVSEDGKLTPFFKGYAYEVLLNVSVLKKDWVQAKKYLSLAEEQLTQVKDKENQGYLKKDLIKWEKMIK